MRTNVYLKPDFLINFMLEKGLTTKKLSELIGISAFTLFNLTKKKYPPRFVVQQKIKNFFVAQGFKIEDIFEIIQEDK